MDTQPKGGPPRLGERRCLVGVLFVSKSGMPWEDLLCEVVRHNQAARVAGLAG